MNNTKKIWAIILVFVMIVTLIPTTVKRVDTKAAQEFAITSPANNELKAAGYIDIEWNAASGNVKEYKVYVDNALVATTTNTSYEYYTTKVKTFNVYVQAVFNNNTTLNSDEIIFGITKKGLGLATDMGANIDLAEMGCAWYYNWGTGPSSGSQYEGIEYVPMVWKETNANNFRSRVENFKKQGYKYVLTFNEPDLAGQCNMSVDDVYNVWQGIEGMEGIKISSPVTALWPSASPNWFQTFMTRVDENGDYQPDFISIHCYPDDYAGASMANWFLENVVDWTWETYKLPIWITEFSTTGQWVTATGNNGTKEFWEAVMPGLDEREYVERYAAFNFNSETTGLWLYNTGELTPAGEIYKTQGNPTGLGQDTEDTTTEAPTQAPTEITTEEPTEVPTQAPTEAPTTTVKPDDSGLSEPGMSFSTSNSLLPDAVSISDIIYTDYTKNEGVSVSATSTLSSADNAIDENIGSRWESEHGVDPQSITIDFGQIREIKKIAIIWETASAKTYTIQVSDDGIAYTDVCDVECSTYTNHRLDEIVLDKMVKGRFIRVYGTTRITGYGYSIFDMAVYGADLPETIDGGIQILGFQLNTDYEGSRVIAAVEPTIDGKAVSKWGYIFGLTSVGGVGTGIEDNDLVVDSNDEYVASYESTVAGTLDEAYADSTTATYFARTMSFGHKNLLAFTAGYKVRAYALLEDGAYVYSDVSDFTVYDIADTLYQGNLFSTQSSHDYAYNTILSLVNPYYEKKDFDITNSVV